MSHFHIDVVVTSEEVEIIKREFNDFIMESGGFSLIVRSDDGDVDPSPELAETIKKMFFNLLMTVHYGQFRRIN